MNQYPSIPGAPGAPSYPGAPQAPAAPLAQAPQGWPQPGPGFAAAPPGPPPGFPSPAAPLAPFPGASVYPQAPPPGFAAAPQYAPAPAPPAPQGWPAQAAASPGFGAMPPPMPANYGPAPAQYQQRAPQAPAQLPGNINDRIAAATMGNEALPRLVAAHTLGQYDLEVVESGQRAGTSQKNRKPYNVLFVEARVLASTFPGYPPGVVVSISFPLEAQGDADIYAMRRLKQFEAGLFALDFNDPHVPQVTAMLQANQCVGRRFKAEVRPQANGKIDPRSNPPMPYAEGVYGPA